MVTKKEQAVLVPFVFKRLVRKILRQAQDDDVSLILFVICRGAYYAPAFYGKSKPFPYGLPPIRAVILNAVKNPKEILRQAQDDDVSLILFIICRGDHWSSV